MKIFLKTCYGYLRIPMKVRKSYFKLTGRKISINGRLLDNKYYFSWLERWDINLIKSVERYCPNNHIRGFIIVEVPDDNWNVINDDYEMPERLLINGELQPFVAP